MVFLRRFTFFLHIDYTVLVCFSPKFYFKFPVCQPGVFGCLGPVRFGISVAT